MIIPTKEMIVWRFGSPIVGMFQRYVSVYVMRPLGIAFELQFTLCQPSGWSLTDQPAGSFCLAPPWFRLNHVEFTKTSFLEKRKDKHDIPSHYHAPEMFLFTDTKFKQELNTQNINKKQLKNMLFQW